MPQTRIQTAFKPFKTHLPKWISNPIRSLLTAFLTPIFFSHKTGHFASCFKKAAVSKKGDALPWYTYPCINFLKFRNFEDKIILEFGGGQSTLWWAKKAKHVVTFEGDKKWYEKIKAKIPSNVDLHLVTMESPSACIEQINDILRSKPYSVYDVIIIDGLYRYEIIDIARKVMPETGVIICDNAEGYRLYKGFKESDLNRVDFFGYAPGVILPHCTSIFSNSYSFIFSSKHPIPVIANEE